MIRKIKNIGKYKYQNIDELNNLCESLHNVLLDVFGNLCYDIEFRGVESGDYFNVLFDLGLIDSTDVIYKAFWKIMRLFHPEEQDKDILYSKYLQSLSGLYLCISNDRLDDEWTDELLNSHCRILRQGYIVLKPSYCTEISGGHVSDNVVY